MHLVLALRRRRRARLRWCCRHCGPLAIVNGPFLNLRTLPSLATKRNRSLFWTMTTVRPPYADEVTRSSTRFTRPRWPSSPVKGTTSHDRIVAERAQTGKASIYRRWPNKLELALDAIETHCRRSAHARYRHGPRRPTGRPASVREAHEQPRGRRDAGVHGRPQDRTSSLRPRFASASSRRASRSCSTSCNAASSAARCDRTRSPTGSRSSVRCCSTPNRCSTAAPLRDGDILAILDDVLIPVIATSRALTTMPTLAGKLGIRESTRTLVVGPAPGCRSLG